MHSSNPMFSGISRQGVSSNANSMTANGATNKAAILLLVVFATSIFSYLQSSASGATGLSGLALLGAFGGFILAIITIFKPNIANITAPIYAGLEGLFLGGISFLFEGMYPGIASQAVMGTIILFFIMMFLYRTGIIQVNAKFRSVMFCALIGVGLLYLSSFILSFFGVRLLPSSGPIAKVISIAIVAIAAFSLLLDFDMIERMEEQKAPQYMEWYAAFSILVTLVWLYIEVLRLISIFRSK